MNNQKDIMQVFGCLMKQPSLLSQTDKYKFYVDDFSSRFERKVFSSILYLWQHGAESISEVDIVNYFSNIQSEYDYFEEQNGLEYITDCIELSDILSFDYYYERVKKFSLLSQLRKIGYNTDKIYNENNLSENSEEINKDFEQKTIKEIVDELNNELIKISEKCLSEDSNKTSDAAKGAQELIDGLKGAPDTGARLQGKFFNTVVRGARRGKFYIRSASSGVGKALPNYTKIPTPDGWKTVGQIKVGDYLFDREGKPTRVLGVYPQPEKKQIYEVKFRSGRVAECCGEHLWSYYKTIHGKKLYTSSLQKILEEGKKNNFKKFGKYCYRVPISEAVELPEKKYSISPYIMGLILGDGSFRYYKANKSFMFSSENSILPNIIANELNLKVKRHKSNKYCWYFEHTNQDNKHKNLWVEELLKDYPELWNTNSHTKFIPEDYLFGSIEQRKELLRGLLDTDGSIRGRTAQVSYTTVSEKLRDNFICLCSSLGYLTSLYKENKPDGRIAYHINIIVDNYIKPSLFKLERKVNLAKELLKKCKPIQNGDKITDPIIRIEATDKYVDMTCFYVDNEEHLFAAGDTWWITHNTRNTIGDACYLSYPICWNNEQNKWDFTGATEKVLIIVTEQEKDEVQTMIISYLSGVNEEKILYGSYNDEESDRIQKALWIMDKYNNLYITEMPNPNVQQIKFVVKEMCRRYDIGYVFYDYLFSNPSLLNEYRDLKIREDQALGIFSAELKALAVETNTFILTSTQTNAKVEDDGKEIKNESVIRGSRAIIDKADIACVCARPSQEDLEHIEPYCSFLKPNIVTDIYKVRRGRFNNVRIWSYIDLGTCRKVDLFVTNTQYELVEVGNLKQQYDEDQSWLIQSDVNELNDINSNQSTPNSVTIEYIDQSTGEVKLKEKEVKVNVKKQNKGLFDI